MYIEGLNKKCSARHYFLISFKLCFPIYSEKEKSYWWREKAMILLSQWTYKTYIVPGQIQTVQTESYDTLFWKRDCGLYPSMKKIILRPFILIGSTVYNIFINIFLDANPQLTNFCQRLSTHEQFQNQQSPNSFLGRLHDGKDY